MPYPVIPEYITVHLGAPDAPAQNVTVPFTDYIKNVRRAKSIRHGRKARCAPIF